MKNISRHPLSVQTPTATLSLYETRWRDSNVEKYIPILSHRIDSLIQSMSYQPNEEDMLYFDEEGHREGIVMEAFSITEMLAQACAGGMSWIFSDKARFLSPTVDLLTIIESRTNHSDFSMVWGNYRDSIGFGSYDFLQASEHNQGWLETLNFSTNDTAYLLWSASKVISLLGAQERIKKFTPIALSDTEVLAIFCKCESPIESILLMQLIVDGLKPPLLKAQWHDTPYRIDFALPKERIAIECDGKKYHDKKRDAIRDKILQKRGWVMLRFSSEKIIRDTIHCSATIHAEYPWKNINS